LDNIYKISINNNIDLESVQDITVLDQIFEITINNICDQNSNNILLTDPDFIKEISLSKC
jgi:hypothetical protein